MIVGSRRRSQGPLRLQIVVIDRTVLSGAIARMLAEDVSPASGSTASAKTVPSDPTTTDQNSAPGALELDRPSGTNPAIRTDGGQGATDRLVAGLERQVQGAVGRRPPGRASEPQDSSDRGPKR